MRRVLALCVLVSIILTACGSSDAKNKKDEVAVKSTSVKITDKENQKKGKVENKKNETEEIEKDKGDTRKENNDEGMTEDVKENEEIYDLYLNLSKENPINLDKDIEYKILNKPNNYTDKAVAEFNRKYFEIWDAELNAIYNKLLAVIEDDEKKLLIESQKGWLQFHLNDPEFVFKTFRERETGSIMGTVVCTHIYYLKYERIRTRTLELMEYYYLLGKGIDFEYKRQFEDTEEHNKEEEVKGSNKASNDKITKNNKVYTNYDTGGQYYQVSYENPIDDDYEIELEKINNSPEYSTHMVLQFQYKYNDIWDKELNTIYNKLVEELNKEEKELLLQSQLGWVQFHMNEDKFFQKTFYERESGPILGSIDKIQILDTRMERIKSRTIELMEYYYYLGKGRFDFEYESKL